MTTDTSEKGLESLIVRAMTGRTDLLSPPHVATETAATVAGGTGWLLGDPKQYDRSVCVDLLQLHGFIQATQPKAAQAIAMRCCDSCSTAVVLPAITHATESSAPGTA